MRIPSELHGESLYGRKSVHRGSPSAGSSWRRVLRLSLVLVLVVIVMRQAGRPGVYEVFFPATPRQLVVTGSQGLPPAEPVTELVATVEGSPAATIDAALATWLQGGELATETRQRLDLDARGSGPEVAIEIQRELIGAAIDGSVWRAADGPGLFATLAMHDPRGRRFSALQAARPAATIAGVLPLLQQPEVYLGQSLIAAGKIVAIDHITAPRNSFAVEQYWNLWLLPDDASGRPWLVIVADLPSSLRGLLSSPTSGSDAGNETATKQSYPVVSPHPSVRVVGEFLKRLSYQSEAGAELTPVLVGHVESLRPHGNPIVSASIEAANPEHLPPAKQDREIPVLWILLGSGLVGVLLAAIVMWRTAVSYRHLRQRRARREVKLGVLLFAISISSGANLSSAQSLTDLLPGFDVPRMQTLTRNAQASMGSPNINVDEIAKLVFRLERLGAAVLQERVQQSASPPIVGDAVVVDAVIVDSQPLIVGTELRDYLELERVEMIELEPLDGIPRILFATRLPDGAAVGDRINGVAVRLRTASADFAAAENPNLSDRDEIIVDVAGRLRWTPGQPNSPAQKVLAMAGVDLSRLTDLKALDRQPLGPSDSAVFYPLIGAARAVSAQSLSAQAGADDSSSDERFAAAVTSMRADAKAVAPVDLLRHPSGFTAAWIQLDVESVRITRVAVTSPQRQREIGGEFYYEIDAIGDLGNVELQIQVPEGDPVVMDNRYPVTIVSPTLPEFLKPTQSSSDQLVYFQRTAIRVEGFFYRLWGYESDLMQRRGGKQFAPLIVAAVISDRTPVGSDPLGVQVIGKIAAGGVLAAILGVLAYHLINRRGDREARRRRRGHEG